MPPARKFRGCTIVYDTKTSTEFAEKAKESLLKLCALKWIDGSQADDCNLILMNCTETANSVNSKQPAMGLHISEVADNLNYRVDDIKSYLNDEGSGNADWLMALTVAIENIKTKFYNEKGIVGIQLLLISDFSTPSKLREPIINFIIQNLNKMNIKLIIMGPEVKIPFQLQTLQHVWQWQQSLEFLSDDEESMANLKVAQRIVRSCDGVICGLDLGPQLFLACMEPKTLQPWKVPLEIGTRISFNTTTTRFLRAVKLNCETVYGKLEDDSENPNFWKWHLAEDIAKVIDYSDVIGGLVIHDKFIPLPSDVETLFKSTAERCFRIIAFTNMNYIPKYLLQGDGAHKIECEESTFYLLLKALTKKNSCALAERIYNNGNSPKLMALLPRLEDEVFIMVELPYSNNILKYIPEEIAEEAKPRVEATDPHTQICYDYLDSLDVTEKANKDEKGNVKIPLGPLLTQPFRHSQVHIKGLQKTLREKVNISSLEIPTIGDASKKRCFQELLVENPSA